MSDTDWIDKFIDGLCMHSQRAPDGTVTIIYEGMSPIVAKAAIEQKLNEARIEAATHCKEIQPVTDGMKFERWNDRIDSYIEALQATKEKQS